MDQFFIWLSNNTIATYIFILSFSVLVIFYVSVYSIAFAQGREVSFWPPKIGPKSSDKTAERQKGRTGKGRMIVRSYFDEPILISHEKKNRRKISSDFIHWEQCTFMMWVLVPTKGERLRDAPDNRYLLAHNTGMDSNRKFFYYNQFSLRYSQRNSWQVVFSNSKAKYNQNGLQVPDGLAPGWHHFLVAWDRPERKIIFLIDGDRGGSDRSEKDFEFWPEELSDKAIIGGGANEYWKHYCETKLYSLVIIDKFLDIKDSEVREHLEDEPITM